MNKMIECTSNKLRHSFLVQKDGLHKSRRLSESAERKRGGTRYEHCEGTPTMTLMYRTPLWTLHSHKSTVLQPQLPPVTARGSHTRGPRTNCSASGGTAGARAHLRTCRSCVLSHLASSRVQATVKSHYNTSLANRVNA